MEAWRLILVCFVSFLILMLLNAFSVAWTFSALPTDGQIQQFEADAMESRGDNLTDRGRGLASLAALTLAPLWAVTPKILGKSDTALFFGPALIGALLITAITALVGWIRVLFKGWINRSSQHTRSR